MKKINEQVVAMERTYRAHFAIFTLSVIMMVCLVFTLLIGAAVMIDGMAVRAAEPGFTYTLPGGWEAGSEQAAVAAATSPDKSFRLIIRSFPMNTPMTALQIIQGQMRKVSHDRVVTPPTDLSSTKAHFGADTVAKMQLGGTAANGGKYLYRCFVFVKGNRFVVFEGIVNTTASEETFRQADGCINSFRFN